MEVYKGMHLLFILSNIGEIFCFCIICLFVCLVQEWNEYNTVVSWNIFYEKSEILVLFDPQDLLSLV